MPATSVYGLRYPHLDDQAGHDPVQTQRLAEDTEAMLAGLLPDTGVLSGPTLSMGPGMALTDARYRIIGNEMELFVWAENTGVVILGSSTGNITGDPAVATITQANRRPAFTWFGTYVASQVSGQCQIDAGSGAIQLLTAQSGGDINSGDTIRIHALYPLP